MNHPAKRGGQQGSDEIEPFTRSTGTFHQPSQSRGFFGGLEQGDSVFSALGKVHNLQIILQCVDPEIHPESSR